MVENKSRTQLHLFLAFFRVGIFRYGGGPASIPLVQKEVVEKYSWMNDDEFADILAIGNTLPGPIATKMAGYIGYRVGGWVGMTNAIIASVIPTALLMIVFLTSLAAYKDQAWVQGMTRAVLPVVGVMMAVLAWDFFAKAKQGLGYKGSIPLIIVSFLLLAVADLHPGLLIAVLLGYALIKKDKQQEQAGGSS